MISNEQELKDYTKAVTSGIQWSAHKADNEHTLILAVHPSGEASGIEVPNKGFDVWKFRATIKSLLRELNA